MSVIYNVDVPESCIREHQRVIVGNSPPIEFQEAIEHRNKLINRKREILNELNNLEKITRNLTQAIEAACDHDWVTETHYSAGEKDVNHYCKICWKQGCGKAPRRI